MTNNYTDTIELAKKVVQIADEETSRGAPTPTCGTTCYRLAVALLHADTMRQYGAA